MIIRPLYYNHFVILTICFTNLLLSTISFGQEELVATTVSIGVVDRQQIMRDSLAGEGVRQDFEAMEQSYRDEISGRENALRAQQEELSRQKAILTPEAYLERETNFANQVEALQRDVTEINKQLDAMLQYGMRQIDMQTIQIIA